MFFRFQPDVVLLDLQMPKKDGYEVCEEIRKVSSVPILLMTAMEHADTRKKGEKGKLLSHAPFCPPAPPFSTLFLLGIRRS
mmetsp:Transcript_8165/g.21665  ORF Transcript_8165/g.21665 Transcript_8165/m.21665 type:complete len:81 (+) Transcript_8165:938-1180(+)